MVRAKRVWGRCGVIASLLLVFVLSGLQPAGATPGLPPGSCHDTKYACVGGGYAATAATTGSDWAWSYYGEQGAGGIQTTTGPHNCTLYVAWRLQQAGMNNPFRTWGDASQWGVTFGHDGNPTVGSVAWWQAGDHVAYVEQVSADKSQVFIRADNYTTSGSGGYTDSGWISVAGASAPTGFLHPWIPIAAPKISKVTFHDAGPQVTFSAPTVPAGASIQAYEYQERKVGTTNVLNDQYLADSSGAWVTSSPGLAYYNSCSADMACQYRVRAVVRGGASAWSTWVAIAGITAPAILGVNKLQPSDPGPTLTFLTPTIPAGASLQAYEYQERKVGTTNVLNDQYLTDSSGAWVTSSPGMAYYSSCTVDDRCEYRIRAVVQGGASAWSSVW